MSTPSTSVAFAARPAQDLAYEVINLKTGDSHGRFESLDEARGCVEFDELTRYQIWFNGRWAEQLVEEVNPDPERLAEWDRNVGYNAGARIADDCFCPSCGARGFRFTCPTCAQS